MSVYYSDATITVHAGDCLDVLRELPDSSVDSVCTDPPYGLSFMSKKWDSFAAEGRGAKVRAKRSAEVTPTGQGHSTSGGAYLAAGVDDTRSGGAPFQQWCESWAQECLRVLKPGGHLLSFGGSRTWHRLACAVEDAGFEIRDSIAWLYGSGFPKSLDVSKAIDKRPGVPRHSDFAAHLTERRESAGLSRADVSERVVGTRSGACWNWEHHQFPESKWWPALRNLLDMDEATWGPIVAEADRVKTGEHASGLATGSAGVGASGAGGDRHDRATTGAAARWQGWGTALKPAYEPIVVGRKPLTGTVAQTVLLHGTGALNIDGCRVGTTKDVPTSAAVSGQHGVYHPMEALTERSGMDPNTGRWPANVLLDDSQAAALDHQSGEQRDGFHVGRNRDDSEVSNEIYGARRKDASDGGYGSSGGASRFFPTFKYTAKAATTERVRLDDVAHPTVKPLDLMRWLVRLVTPPGGTVLDPFAGSGTTAEACLLEGFRCITIERETDYLPLIVQRIHRRRDPIAAVRATGEDLGLFGEDTA